MTYKPGPRQAKAEIPDIARRAMHLETVDYANEPEPNLPPPDWMFRVYAVVCTALALGVLAVLWRAL